MSAEIPGQEQIMEVAEEIQSGCKSCGNQEVEDNYKLDLCTDCRDKLVKRPFPIWIKGIFVLMVLILIIALIRFPSTIGAGIAFERGNQAEKAGKYLTAEREYKIVTERFPDSTLSIARLFIATYNNGNISEADELLQKIAGRTPDDEKLVNEVNHIVNRMDIIYSISDELNKLFEEHPDNNAEEYIEILKTYLETHPTDVQASYYLSNFLFDQKEYDEAEKIMLKTLTENSDFYAGQLLMAAICREKGEYEKAVNNCNNVIADNVEYPSAYASLAKIELKFHNDQEGLEMAKKAYELDKDNSNIVATLALAYHYNNLIKERDDMFNRFKQFNDNNTYDLKLLEGVFSNQKKWRD